MNDCSFVNAFISSRSAAAAQARLPSKVNEISASTTSGDKHKLHNKLSQHKANEEFAVPSAGRE